MRFMGNLTTWREILTFDIKKYIRNGGKCNYIPSKNAFFLDPAIPTIEIKILIFIVWKMVFLINFRGVHHIFLSIAV